MKKYVTIILLCSTIWLFSQNETSEIKPYQEVITSDAISEKGFITTHILNNKLYLEIPVATLNKDLLFVKHQLAGWRSENQIRLINRENQIHLVIQEIESKVGNKIPLLDRKFNIKITPVSFPILAIKNKTLSYVIDATSLFVNTPKGLHGSSESIVDDATFINKAGAFTNTIEVKTTRTVITEEGPLTRDVDFSFMLLPEPMIPRLFDYRMGFFTEKWNLTTGMVRASIARWRLEKKDKDQVLSEPTKPIIFYFDPTTPDKWKPYLKAGVYEWLPAFEAAGFKNAIVVKDLPINDKNWSMNSMRYSYIRWNDKTNYRGKEGGDHASAATIIDQRTGEILKGDIIISAPYEYLSDEYFIRCSPLDPRAQEYPFPDDLMGTLIQRVTAHEAGHVFGLKDGNYGEYTYPFEKMRDEKWLREMGHTPSVMNYTRQNFIVQPEDNMPLSLLRQKVGPTDIYSIRWAYTQFQNINSPDDELPYLEKIVREQDSIPWYRYGGTKTSNMIGPDSMDQVVESDNPIKATVLGLENLKRVIKLIPNATRNERDNTTLKRLYTKTLNFWVDQMKSVVSLVGGYTTQIKAGNQDGPVYDYTTIPASRQKEAVKFLIKEAFNPPLWMMSPDITRRFETNGTLFNISTRQIKILSELMSSLRLKNMEEIDLTQKDAYNISDLLQDLHRGLWNELEDKTIKINPYRQEIQMAYITILTDIVKLERPNYKSKYISIGYNKYRNGYRGEIFNELTNLKNAIEEVIHNVNDTSTKGHLKLCLLELNRAQG